MGEALTAYQAAFNMYSPQISILLNHLLAQRSRESARAQANQLTPYQEKMLALREQEMSQKGEITPYQQEQLRLREKAIDQQGKIQEEMRKIRRENLQKATKQFSEKQKSRTEDKQARVYLSRFESLDKEVSAAASELKQLVNKYNSTKKFDAKQALIPSVKDALKTYISKLQNQKELANKLGKINYNINFDIKQELGPLGLRAGQVFEDYYKAQFDTAQQKAASKRGGEKFLLKATPYRFLYDYTGMLGYKGTEDYLNEIEKTRQSALAKTPIPEIFPIHKKLLKVLGVGEQPQGQVQPQPQQPVQTSPAPPQAQVTQPQISPIMQNIFNQMTANRQPGLGQGGTQNIPFMVQPIDQGQMMNNALQQYYQGTPRPTPLTLDQIRQIQQRYQSNRGK